jgi:hypothetical protein
MLLNQEFLSQNMVEFLISGDCFNSSSFRFRFGSLSPEQAEQRRRRNVEPAVPELGAAGGRELVSWTTWISWFPKSVCVKPAKALAFFLLHCMFVQAPSQRPSLLTSEQRCLPCSSQSFCPVKNLSLLLCHWITQTKDNH